MESLDTLNSVESTLFEIPVFNLVRKMPRHVLALLTCVSRVPAGSRCCPGHVNDDAFTDQAIHMMSNCRPNTDFNRTEIVDMFNKVRETLLNNKERGISFDSK
jgi:hypothetical protein